MWMRKLAIVLLALMLSGCTDAYETVMDDHFVPERVEAGTVSFLLPEQASVYTMEDDAEAKLWLLEDYQISTYVHPSGDIESTIRTLTGYERNVIAPICLEMGNVTRYECTWTTADGEGQQMNRAMILDDGNYHYALCLQGSAEASADYADEWNQIMASVSIAP